MSAPNFARHNSNGIYAFGEARYYTAEDIEANDWDESMIGEYDYDGTQMDYDWAIENCHDLLKESGWYEIDEHDNDRNYPSHYFMEKEERIACGPDNSIIITVKAMTTAGYYVGANFDWSVSVKLDTLDYWTDQEYDEVPDSTDVINDNWYNNAGMSKIQAKRIAKRVQDLVESMTNEAEAAFSQACSMKLVCTAIFSNGEAIYEKVA